MPQIGKQIKSFCNQSNVKIIDSPIHDHRAIAAKHAMELRRKINLI